jgi:hypothetical protein
MTNKEFDEFLKSSQIKQSETLISKAKEYSVRGDDRFEDFKLIAEMAKVPVNIVFRVLMSKHLVSVIKLLSGELTPNPEINQEKFGDAANYLELGKAWLSTKGKKAV